MIMCARSLLPAMRELELFLGHTHRCMRCRGTFLAHEDGCSHCGVSAPVRLLNKLQNRRKKTSDKNVWYWLSINKVTGKIERTFPGDSCPWPREEKNKEEK